MFSIQEQCSWIFLSVQGYFSACIGPHISCQKPNSIFHTEATFYTLALDSEGQAHDLWPTFERVGGGGWWGVCPWLLGRGLPATRRPMPKPRH